MNITFRRSMILTLVCLLFSVVTFEGFSQSVTDSGSTDETDVFRLSPAVDFSVTAAGIAVLTADLLIEPVIGTQQSIDSLFFPDNMSIFPYSPEMDTACDILFGASLLLPAVSVIGTDIETTMEVGVMFLETMLLTFGTKELVKDLVVRYRPYTYLSAPVDDDYMRSFPSGHTAMTFAVCSFASYLYSELNSGSGWKIPFVAGAYTLASAAGVLRVVSGNHFPTDVVAGAVIGTVFGIGVPWLHKISSFEDSGVCLYFPIAENPGLTVAYKL